jgi:alpha-L-arabinofuranosidase
MYQTWNFGMTVLKLAVHLSKTVRKVVPEIIGINTNFLTDHAAARSAGQGFGTALRKLGVRSLRYPGGEKSDEYFWSTPPWDAPRPTLALTGPNGRLSPMTDYVENYHSFRHKPLDFDEFIRLCQSQRAEPIICVNFDSMYLPPVSDKGTAPTRDQLLEHALEWVRYANVVKGYGVKYWELGNESYLLGSNGAAKAADYARDFVDFSRAMKNVDPSIHLGANGHTSKDARGKADGEDGPIWWQTVLQTAAADIDFLVVHPYPCWKWSSYAYYIDHCPDFTEAADQMTLALAEWAPQHTDRIRVLVTETNAADWAASEHFPELTGWPLVNDLGHALVLFEILGQHLLHPRVDQAQVWNTRWVKPAEKQLWNTLDENNQFNATGHAVAIWGQHLLDEMVAATSDGPVRCFASYAPESRALNLFIINKGLSTQPAALTLSGSHQSWTGEWWALTGNSPEDPSPEYKRIGGVEARSSSLLLDLPPLSISVVKLKPLDV